MNGKLTITMNLGNADYNNFNQVASTLHEIALDARYGTLHDGKTYLDQNGNAVVTVKLKIKPEKKRKGMVESP